LIFSTAKKTQCHFYFKTDGVSLYQLRIQGSSKLIHGKLQNFGKTLQAVAGCQQTTLENGGPMSWGCMGTMPDIQRLAKSLFQSHGTVSSKSPSEPCFDFNTFLLV